MSFRWKDGTNELIDTGKMADLKLVILVRSKFFLPGSGGMATVDLVEPVG